MFVTTMTSPIGLFILRIRSLSSFEMSASSFSFFFFKPDVTR